MAEVDLTGSLPKRRGELLGSLLVGFHSKVSTLEAFCQTETTSTCFYKQADICLSGYFEGVASEDARTKVLHASPCRVGARQAFLRQNSRPEVLTVAMTQNVALASQSNNYFASFWLWATSMQSTAERRSEMISISTLLYLSKRGRLNTRSSDLNAMLITQTQRMSKNNNGPSALALLEAMGFNGRISLHSTIFYWIPQSKQKLFMLFLSDALIYPVPRFKLS